MSKIQRMSDAEKEIMQIIWAAGGSISSAWLLDELKNRNKDWKPNTVLTFLARLIEKGILTAKKHGRANEYIPLVSANEYKHFETRSFLDSVYGGSIRKFIYALYEGDDLTKDEIEDLKKWFSQR